MAAPIKGDSARCPVYMWAGVCACCMLHMHISQPKELGIQSHRTFLSAPEKLDIAFFCPLSPCLGYVRHPHS